jgi:hypothetical protein
MLLLIAPLRFATNLFLIESCVRLVAVAQLAEHRIVAPKVAGSSPVGHPLICRKNVKLRLLSWLLVLQPYCNPLAEGFVEPFHGVVAYAPQEVRVGIHSLHNTRVAEERLHHLRVFAALDQGRAERVAQAVERELRVVESGLLQKRFIFSVVEVVVVHGVTDAVGEHEIVVVPYGGAESLLVRAFSV